MEYSREQETLRKKLLQEALESVRGLEGRREIVAAILTGSAAWGKPNPDGDLDILIVTDEGTGAVYRYILPGFCPVRRRIEHGMLPRRIVLEQIGKGYDGSVSGSMIEQFKHGRVLFQREREGEALIEAARLSQPRMVAIGARINEITLALAELGAKLERDRPAEVLRAARRIMRLVVRMLLLARESTGISKEKHEYRAVRRHLGTDEIEAYERAMDVSAVTVADARRAVAWCIGLLEWILEERSIRTEMVRHE